MENNLELVITPLQKMEAIKFNYEDLKKGLKNSLKKYENLTYTDETIKEAKDDRAMLNNLKKSLNDEKIKIKKEFMIPYDDFENKIKELIELVDQPASAIDKQVKDFEEKEKSKKRENITKIYQDNIGSYAELIPLEKIYDSRWENKTYKETDITKEIQDIAKKADNDVKVIEELKSEFDFQIKDAYFRSLDLGQALIEKTRLEKQKELLSTPKEDPIKNNDDAIDAIAYAVNDAVEKAVDEYAETVEKVCVIFKVECSPEKLTGLGEYMKANGIKYGRA